MASIELSGLVDPGQPLDPAAQRALAARELKRLGPTPGAVEDHMRSTNWIDEVRIQFASLDNAAAREILDCALDPTYSSSERPEGVDARLKVYVELAIAGSELPDRIHSSLVCTEALSTHMQRRPVIGTIWDLTDTFSACQTCVVIPAVSAAAQIKGRDRHRVNIRTNVFRVLTDLQQGAVHWPAVHRLADLETERWAPRLESGFVDTGNPERWAADPIAGATVELAVAVGHATGQHLAALWDACMIEVLAKQASAGDSAKIRRKAAKALAAAIDGHSWDELTGIVAGQIDTRMTRLKSVEKRVSAVLSEFEPAISALVADELDSLETHAGVLTEWNVELLADSVSDDAVVGTRMVMAWHGGPVPSVVLRSIRAYPFS